MRGLRSPGSRAACTCGIAMSPSTNARCVSGIDEPLAASGNELLRSSTRRGLWQRGSSFRDYKAILEIENLEPLADCHCFRARGRRFDYHPVVDALSRNIGFLY